MFSVIRKATDEDVDRLRAAAERFCARHGIEFDEDVSAETAIDFRIENDDTENARRLARLWGACASRALRLPTRGKTPYIAYGYVGTSAR